MLYKESYTNTFSIFLKNNNAPGFFYSVLMGFSDKVFTGVHSFTAMYLPPFGHNHPPSVGVNFTSISVELTCNRYIFNRNMFEPKPGGKY